MDISNASRISSGQSASGESIAEMEQRLRAEHQEAMAKMREEFQLQRQQQFQQLPNQSDQLQQFQLFQEFQRQQMQNQQNTQVPEVQQNQPARRNPQSDQPSQFHEDEYRPQNNIPNDMPDETFFNDLRHDSFVQTMITGDELVIPGFTNHTHDSTAAWNQSGENPLSGGININGCEFNIHGGRNISQIGGNGNRGGRTSAGRTSAGSASGGRASAGRTARARGGNALN
jgi:hypothetical protein